MPDQTQPQPEAAPTTAPKAPSTSKVAFFATTGGRLATRVALAALAAGLVAVAAMFVLMGSLGGSADSAVADAEASLGAEATASIEALRDDVASTQSTLLMALIAVAVLGSVAVGAVAYKLTQRITAGLAPLRDAAKNSVATLPEFVHTYATSGGEVPAALTIPVTSGGLAGDLASTFNELQLAAGDLVVKQAHMRAREFGRMIDLGRRNQELLSDQMAFIQEMEQDEPNPTNLQRLFRIDHIASRMRRTTASMLVIAGRDSSHELEQAVLVHHVVQAASCGIEYFDRVAIADLSSVAVDPVIAPDLAHLIAELLENATISPSNSPVTVNGKVSGDGYMLEIIDHGLGMAPAELAGANRLFADPDAANREAMSTSQLGHVVAGRLAHRHGVRVELSETHGGGVTALIQLPQLALTRIPKQTFEVAAPTPEAPMAEPMVAAPIEPVVEAVAAPVVEAVVAPEVVAAPVEAVVQPVAQLPVESAVDEPVAPASEVAAEPMPVAEPVAEVPVEPMPVAEPVAEVPAEPMPEPMPVAEPVAEVSVEPMPVAEPVAEVPAEPMSVAERVAEVPVEPMPEPVAEVSDEPVADAGAEVAEVAPAMAVDVDRPHMPTAMLAVSNADEVAETTAAAATDDDAADAAERAIRWRELTAEQSAAIEWARGATSTPVQGDPTPAGATATIAPEATVASASPESPTPTALVTNGLRPGPISAAALAELSAESSASTDG